MNRMDQLLKNVREGVTAGVKADPQAMLVVNCDANSVEHVALYLKGRVAHALDESCGLDAAKGVQPGVPATLQLAGCAERSALMRVSTTSSFMKRPEQLVSVPAGVKLAVRE